MATSAVLHAYEPLVPVRILEREVRLRVEVFDGSPRLPVQRGAAAGAEDGRGLELVHALADRWGVDARPDGKTFWFEIGTERPVA